MDNAALLELSKLVAADTAGVEPVCRLLVFGIMGLLAAAMAFGAVSRLVSFIQWRLLNWKCDREDAYRFELHSVLRQLQGLGFSRTSAWKLAVLRARARTSLSGRARVWSAGILGRVSQRIGGLVD